MARHGRHGAWGAPSRCPRTPAAHQAPPSTAATATSASAPATGPLGFSRNTKHGFFSRGCARDTQSETPARTAAHAARSLLFCALWRGMGRLWRGMGGRRPPHRHPACRVFTSQGTRIMVIPCSSGGIKESNLKPDQRVFTNHETRNTNHGFYAFLPTISRHFPLFPGKKYCPWITVSASSAVLVRLHDKRLSPPLPSPSGLVPLRRTPSGPVLRKEDVRDCADSHGPLFDRSPSD